MTIDKRTDGSSTELILNGWMDTQSAPLLGEQIEALGDETKQLVLNLKDLEYTSSAGIRQIVAAHKHMNGAMTLKNVSSEILELLKMTGLDQKFAIEQ